MTLSDELFEALNTIYEAIANYEHANQYKQDLLEALNNLSYMCLKEDNPHKEVDSQVFDEVYDLTERRYQFDRKGKNWAAVRSGFILKPKQEQKPRPKSERYLEFERRLNEHLKRAGLDIIPEEED